MSLRSWLLGDSAASKQREAVLIAQLNELRSAVETLQNESAEEADNEPTPLESRLVFPYKDETGKRAADPVVVERTLTTILGEDWRDIVRHLNDRPPPGIVGEIADNHKAAQEASRAKVLDAINAAFDVRTFDGRVNPPIGLTDGERFGLLTAFILFIYDMVDKARPFIGTQSRASPSLAV